MARILIADDEADIRTILSMLTSQALGDVEAYKGQEHTTDETVDGQEAINKMQETCYDLILTDILMPRIDGYGVLEYAKSNQNSIPIIALSSTFTERDVKGLKEQGFDYVIPKPFDTKEVRATIKEALEKKLKPE